MKKFLMTLVAAFAVAMSANAQVYVGGGFGINGVDNGNTTVTTYKFIPEVGYNFNENWAAGVAFGWEGASKGGTKTLEVNPYARFTSFIQSMSTYSLMAVLATSTLTTTAMMLTFGL